MVNILETNKPSIYLLFGFDLKTIIKVDLNKKEKIVQTFYYFIFSINYHSTSTFHYHYHRRHQFIRHRHYWTTSATIEPTSPSKLPPWLLDLLSHRWSCCCHLRNRRFENIWSITTLSVIIKSSKNNSVQNNMWNTLFHMWFQTKFFFYWWRRWLSSQKIIQIDNMWKHITHVIYNWVYSGL